MRLVVIPQGVRRVLPALVNQLIALIKESSLVYFLGPARDPARPVPDRSGPGREHRQRVRPAAGRPLLPGHHRAADPRRQRVDARLRTGRRADGRSGRRRARRPGPRHHPGGTVTPAAARYDARHRLRDGAHPGGRCRHPRPPPGLRRPTSVLRGVDLDVAAGTAACVIGPSGSGKSTLLRCVNRLLEPDRGRRAHRRPQRHGGRPRRAAAAGRHGVPALQPVPAQERRSPTSRWGCAGCAGCPGTRPRPRALAQLERVGLRHKAAGAPGHAVRRPAAAGRHRPGAGHGARGDALRRGDVAPSTRSWSRASSRRWPTWPARA